MFNLRLKELREERYKSQQVFADVFGVAQSTVGMWESGSRTPNPETMGKLADFFGVSVDYLLGREEQRETPAGEGGRGVSDELLMFGLWGDSDDVDEEDLADVKRYAQFVRERKRDKGK